MAARQATARRAVADIATGQLSESDDESSSATIVFLIVLQRTKSIAFCGVHTTFLMRQVEVEIEDDRTIIILGLFSYFRATIVFLIVLHFITS